ncbi:hypothetical protein GPJ56_003828 [Histomonas meleagridis]|uniref:uncharacterized protein n=1 Tax=Histomonas meleagridis TaxID=135588 RepID=UPI00355A0656|nr:hypothetical protein GPJ56_003828 [Histomonas meleagridis]KAH0805286.1 hypothetical protein GO595_002231 [Histomonas meleagridis]
MSNENCTQLAQSNPQWSNSLFFTEDKNILYSSVEGITSEQIQSYLDSFKDYDDTIKAGITFNDVHYHVHRFYDGIMYGRADPNTNRTDGFCLYRTNRDGKQPLFALITYELPNVSAKIIPEMAKQIEAIKDQIP